MKRNNNKNDFSTSLVMCMFYIADKSNKTHNSKIDLRFSKTKSITNYQINYLVIVKLLKSFQFQRVGSGEEGFNVSGGDLRHSAVDELEN
jgi:hypothetical protein